MEEATLQKLIKDSLKLLQEAGEKANPDSDRLLVTGIQKARGILEILVDEISDSPVEAHGDEYRKKSYVPEVLPLEALLAPISEENPGGENMRLSGKVNELLKLVVNRSHAADFRPQYLPLRDNAMELLSNCGKDLGVAVRLIEAAITDENSSGFAAVADGLHLIIGLITKFWDDFIPECSDGDFTARCNELEQFEELVVMRLAARYGEPHKFSPVYSDITTAGHDSEVFDDINEQLDVLKKELLEKLEDQTPTLKTLREKLSIFGKRVNEQFENFLRQQQKARQDAAMKHELQINEAMEKVCEEVEKQNTPEVGDTGLPKTNEPESIEDAENRLDVCAQFLVNQAPSEPVGYMVNRGRRWFSGKFKVERANPTKMQEQELRNLFTGKKWVELLQCCENLFTNGGTHWLDLQWYQVTAAERLGREYEHLARYLMSAVKHYVAENKSILEEKKGSMMSDETLQWLSTIRKTSETNDDGDKDNAVERRFEEEVRNADGLVEKGRSYDALKQLQECLNKARSQRERFLWQIYIAEFCIRANMTKVALPGIENMVNTIDRLNLAEWEDPDILLRVFKLGYDGYLSFGYDRAPEDKLDYYYQRICLYDPAHFITNSVK